VNTQPILIAGQWRQADARDSFHAVNPATGQPLPDRYPVSSYADCDAALTAATAAAAYLRSMPGDRIADFLEKYAERIERRSAELVETAQLETALPRAPRLAEVELPRTTNQMRQAAAAARDGSWRLPTIDTRANLRSCLAPLGPVCVFGPNNFPFAFGSVSGGDFAAAIAAGNPVIAKANTSHPATTRLLAEEALAAQQQTDMPPGTVQLLYRLDHADGLRLVGDRRVGASGYTGSRSAGLALKAAADAAGRPIYLELSSINPVVILPGALRERLEAIAEEFVGSGLLGTGQFCTSPGLLILIQDPASDTLLRLIGQKYGQASVGTLLSAGVAQSLGAGVAALVRAGARLAASSTTGPSDRFCHPNTLLVATARQFLLDPETMQTELFGNAALAVVADDVAQAVQVIGHLEGNLTGCIYSAASGADDPDYDRLAPGLRARVGRLLNDKMPTGVAVSPAMNHGGPYPATGHPGFTAVGIPAAIRRFAALHCYDQVRPHRLPECLRDGAPQTDMWRLVDGRWTQGDIAAR